MKNIFEDIICRFSIKIKTYIPVKNAKVNYIIKLDEI